MFSHDISEVIGILKGQCTVSTCRAHGGLGELRVALPLPTGAGMHQVFIPLMKKRTQLFISMIYI